MLSYTELKTGAVFVMDGQPWEVLDYSFSKKDRQKGTAQIRIKNLINGKVSSKGVHSNEEFDEAEIIKRPVMFLYNHRDEYWFADPNELSRRFSLDKEMIGDASKFLKENSEVTAIKFKDEIINIRLPIKVDLKVDEAPPGEKGDTATGGKKVAVLETGTKVNVPLFINTDDVVRVNTETGEYVERVEKN